MAKRTFKCTDCGRVEHRIVQKDAPKAPCECGGMMEAQLPILTGASEVRETVDAGTGVRWKQDQQDMIKQRHDEYFWTHEVPRFVASGTYSVQTMLEQGWIWFDDNKQMQVHTKPPHRR